MCKWPVRLCLCPGGVLSVVRLRSILGVWYVSGVSWLYCVRFAEGANGLGPGLGWTSPSLVTLCIHLSGASTVVGREPVVCGVGVWLVCEVVAGMAPCQDPCRGYRVSGDITL